jgi:antitoxin VapB
LTRRCKKHIPLKYIFRTKTTTKTAKLFSNGQSQAVRPSKDFRFKGDAVYIKKCGSAVVLIPLVISWDSLFASVDKFSKDFMAERNQPGQQKRRAVIRMKLMLDANTCSAMHQAQPAAGPQTLRRLSNRRHRHLLGDARRTGIWRRKEPVR